MVILGKSAHGRERIQKIKASYGSVDLHYRLLAKRPLLQCATKTILLILSKQKKTAENEKQTMSSLLVLPQSLPPFSSSTNN